ncbi:MAG: hypothetical protein ACI8YI_001276 [Paracoccaceae bacterium]|jgi:uncharacterized protein YndB with AHSA1/START domain
MAEVKIERRLIAPIEKVFDFVSRGEHLVKWWGPEGMSIPVYTLDFTKPGPWHSEMQNDDGAKFTVSGQVTHVTAPNSIGFTWAWHDENNQRGNESHVTLTLVANEDGTTSLTLHHQQLASAELAENHTQGWTSSMRKLERMTA